MGQTIAKPTKATNTYGIRLYSSIGPSQERVGTSTSLIAEKEACHSNHDPCHHNHGPCHSNHDPCHVSASMKTQDNCDGYTSKLSDMLRVREDNNQFGFIHNMNSGAIFIAPRETIRRISELLDRKIPEVTEKCPGLIEALTD